jgi:mannitol-1-phosphate 5-dehydrogenase
MSYAMIFGAGRVGRGLLAEVFQQSQCAITFVDKNINLVDELNRSRQYAIHKAYGALADQVIIRDVNALHFDEGGAIADLLCMPDVYVGIAVSPFLLEEIADLLAVAIARRALECPDVAMDVLLCDNSADSVARMEDLLTNLLGGSALAYFREKVGLVRTIVLRQSSEQVPAGDSNPLAILNNGYPEMPVDAKGFKGAPPNSPMLHPTDNFDAEAARKIYTLNLAQAAMAYLGTPLGLTKTPQAISHPRVRPYLEQALEESAHGLCGEYGFARRQMDEWRSYVLTTLENPALDDSLARLGTDAARKVGRHERLAGAATLCQKYDRQPFAIARAIAYAYLYQSNDPGTRRIRECIEQDGIEYALERFSGIDYRNPLRALVLDEYERALDFLQQP